MKTVESEFEEAGRKGKALKALHDAEIVVQGNGLEAPRSRGAKYDIPPTDGTYKADQVDQTGKDSVDLNRVMKRFEKTGQLAELIKLGMGSESGGFYGDFTNAPDFQEALNITIHAQEQFALLSAEVRNRFDNDPAKFLAFASDAKNVDEMETLGLLKPEVVEARQKARREGKPVPSPKDVASTASVPSGSPQATPPASPPS